MFKGLALFFDKAQTGELPHSAEFLSLIELILYIF